jgi:transposase
VNCIFSGWNIRSIGALDFSDDRLALVLDNLSKDSAWIDFETALTQNIIRVYDLQTHQIRIDSTTAKGYVQVTPEGLFQFGHSKDHRPDLPQVKINMSVLDPLGLPVSTTIVAGHCADDPLYVEEIKRVQKSLGRHSLTYIGDSKMAALKTGAFIVASEDSYLCPLTDVQVRNTQWEQLLWPVESGIQPLVSVYRQNGENDKPEKIAEGYESQVCLIEEIDGRTIKWIERRLIIRSLKFAQSQERALRTRIQKALSVISALNERKQGKKRFSEEEELRTAAEQIVSKYRVTGLIHLETITDITERIVRQYGNHPKRMVQEKDVHLKASVDETALDEAIERLGWRVYVTNHSEKELSLEQAVLAYRAEYLVERGFGRLKGKPLSLTTMYLDTDERVTGLIRLLTIGLRVLTLLEFCARKQLKEEEGKLVGIYPGNPKRATSRPTAEMMLRAFEGLTLTVIKQGDRIYRHLTPLSKVQQRILHLLGLSSDIYLQLSQHFLEPTIDLSEP